MIETKLSRIIGKEFRRVPYLYLLPALTLFTVFFIFPVIQSLYMAFFNFNGLQVGKFVGFDHFTRLLDDRYFLVSLKNTAIFTLLNVVIQSAIALPLAVILNGDIVFKNFFKSIFFFPAVMSVVVIGIIFQFILNPAYGVLNVFLKQVGLGFLALNWLGDMRLSLYTVIVVTCWQGIGYAMVIYLGGLQSIPSEILEAADIDGANGFNRFWFIIFPMLAPIFTVAIMISTIANVKEFGRIFVITGGGPAGSSQVLVTYLYKNFAESNYGYGSAVSIVLFVLLMALSLLQYKVLGKREY
jgi:ABC-type sugar transport system permease subunit